MIIVFAILFIAEWFAVIALVVLFGALAFAEMARADPSPWKRGHPSPDMPSPRMTRWHIVAAVLLIGSVLMFSFELACNVATSASCGAMLGGPLQGFGIVFTEVELWFIALAALYGPMYAVRLHRHRVWAAEFIGLGVCVLPAALLNITSIDLATDPSYVLAFGIAGVVLFPFGLALPVRRAKVLVLLTSCVALLIALSEAVGPANPVWLLTAIAMGYTVFRAEWQHLAEASPASDRLPAPDVPTPNAGNVSKRAELSTAMRTVTFIAVNLACVVALWFVWRIGFGAEGTAPAAIFALAGLSIAAIGAALTTLVPAAFGHARLDIDHAIATFVMVLVAAVVIHLIGTPPVMIDSYFGMSTGWKPVLGTFACIGALAIALTTLTGREHQIRPFMMGIILPAAFLLPSDQLFTFIQEDTMLVWTQRLVETGITAIILAIMWYVFGPGRRRESEQIGTIPDRTPDVIPA